MQTSLLLFNIVLRAIALDAFKWDVARGQSEVADSPSGASSIAMSPMADKGIDESAKNQRLFNFGSNFGNLFPFMMNYPTPGNECGVEETKCVSISECALRGGRVKGKCFKGFGVCCATEVVCGAIVRANETYLVNENYPKVINNVGSCQYSIEKMNHNICQLRLDFDILVLAGPNETSQCLEDTFSISGGAGQTPIILCGVNSGQHVYVDLPEGATTARVNIATSSQGPERHWKIKVTQIPCNSPYKAPEHCLQYFTDYSGTIMSFNYQPNEGVHQLAYQMYTICIKAKPGFCGITYKSDDFSISNSGSVNTVSGLAFTGDVDCLTDFVSIFTVSKEGQTRPDRYCGNRLRDVTTFSKPFEVRVITDALEENNDNYNRGFKIQYLQIPC